ncbi:MAG: hypothetical protein FD155_2682 [Bacteroidetes bacterium]|nr:MAG: hypothetical protein FD155_2682 [Bacteroidota bacterium]
MVINYYPKLCNFVIGKLDFSNFVVKTKRSPTQSDQKTESISLNETNFFSSSASLQRLAGSEPLNNKGTHSWLLQGEQRKTINDMVGVG